MKKKSSLAKRLLALVGGVLLVGFVAAGGYAAYLNYRADRALSSVKRENLLPSSPTASSSSPTASAPTGPLNYLLMGTDSRGKDDPGRSDTMMVAHIPADRSKVYLISIPRDSYVEIPGKEGKHKINSAYAFGGAPLTVETVNALLGISIDHVAQVNFKGFMRLVETLGGVTITNPREVYDDSQHVHFAKGKITLDRDTALKYVRSRHGWPNGDLDRAANQQRVLKAIAAKILSKGTLADPGKATATMDELVKHITVDSTLSPEEMKGLLLSLRLTGSQDIVGITLPVKGFEDTASSGQVDLLDSEKLALLKEALAADDLATYVATADSPQAVADKASPTEGTPEG